jgi:hypothetical protein
MKKLVLSTCAAASLLVGLGSIAANANPAIAKSDIGWSKSIVKVDWDDHPRWWRHHHRDWDRDDWRGRWWGWHRHRDWDRDDWRWRHHHRDWDDRR